MSECRVAEHVRWAVEPAGVVLIDRTTGASATLDYPRAAIWDFLTRGETEEQMCGRMCAIASLDRDASLELLRRTVTELLAAGWLAEDNG